MANLYVCFSANSVSPLDRLIQWVERRYESADVLEIDRPLASHAWVEIEDVAGNEWARPARWAIEAIPRRVHVFDPAIKGGQVVRRYRAPITGDQADDAWLAAVPYDGRAYNAVGVVFVGLLLLLHRPRLFEAIGGAKVFCSQLTLIVIRATGIDPLPGMYADNTTPAALEAALITGEWEPETPAAAAIERRAA